MKLAIVSPFPPEVSGVGQYGARLSAGLARTAGVSEVRVFGNRAPAAPGHDLSEGYSVERLWARDSLTAAPTLLRAVMQWRPDAVWFNLGLSVFGRSRLANFYGLLSPAVSTAAGLPTVVTLHEIFEAVNLRALGAMNGRITHWGAGVAMRALLRADAVCVTLQSYVQVVRDKYGAGNVVHIPHGAFDPPHFTPLPAQKRILIFGSVAPYKGLEQLIDIHAQIRQADPSLVLTIAGADHPRFPGYLESVRAARPGLAGVEWVPNPSESRLPALFQSAWVVALPNTATTGASSVLHRAAAHGRPVVAYDLPDLRAVAAEEMLQVAFVPAADKAAFARHLQALLQDRRRCERIGLANVDTMHAHTLDVTCRRYIEVFNAAIEGRLPAPWAPRANEAGPRLASDD